MKKNIGIAIIVTLLLACTFWKLTSREYPLPPLEKRASTQYITLPTGSQIGYTLVPAQGAKKEGCLIYLHGGPGGRVSNVSIETFSAFSKAGYDVFLYDQIGSGYSARLDNITAYTLDRHMQDLDAIITHLGVEKVILLGQSWGCILATHFVSRHPEKVEKMILNNPGPLFPYSQALENIPIPDSLPLKSPIFTNAQGNAKVNNWRINFIQFFATQFGLKLATDAEVDAFSTYASFEINKSCVFDTSKFISLSATPSIPNLSGYYASVMTLQSLQQAKDPRKQLKTLQTPLLVIKAQYDNQKWGYTQEYLRLFTNSHLQVIHNAGHIIELEQALELQRTILTFLQHQ